MGERREKPIRWLALAILGLVVAIGVATGVFYDDVMRTRLDPQVPFQTYRPPPAPDYDRTAAWALAPGHPASPAREDGRADVFFIAPTTFDGGADWNAPIGDARADSLFRRVMAPNYAAPFASLGRMFAPRYRQASLYSQLTLREDARAARAFAYGDVARAFHTYVTRFGGQRPFVLVGVEQGGLLAQRLIAEVIAPDPSLRRRLVAAYLIEAAAPADTPPAPPCRRKGEPGCLAAWISVERGQADRAAVMLDRALVWGRGGELVNLAGRPVLCFNPILGATTEAEAPARLALGAANATGLEWGARPGFLARQVSAKCRDGVLYVSRPRSANLQVRGRWADRRKAPAFNLFWADLEADAKARLAAWSP
jgi:hypothetical protein